MVLLVFHEMKNTYEILKKHSFLSYSMHTDTLMCIVIETYACAHKDCSGK